MDKQDLMLNNKKETEAKISENNTNSPTPEKEDNRLKPKLNILQNSKIIYAILGIIILLELVWAAKSLLSPITPVRIKQIQPINSGKIILDSSRTSFKTGEMVPVTVKLVTGGREIDGVDMILRFDPKIIEATVAADFKKGSIYQDYPLIDINKSGVIRISAISDPNKGGFVGVGNLGVIYFKAKAAGVTELTFDFQKGATTDSNLIESGTTQDVLDQVVNLKLMIGDNAVSQTSVNENSCLGYTQYCQVGGKIGTQFCSGGKSNNGSCVFDLKLTNACTACQAAVSNK